MQIELVYEAQNTLCEGPIWRADRQELWWVDVDAGHLQKWSEREGCRTVLKRDYSIGTFALTTGEDLILGTRIGIEWLHMDSGKLSVLHNLSDTPHLRFNDGKPDPSGRFWVGTMPMTSPEFPLGLGALYRMDTDLSLHKMDDGICLSNGMDWNTAGDAMLYADTTKGVIYNYDYDDKNGDISNRSTLISMDRSLGLPDGVTIDQEDHIWVACPKRGVVFRYTPDGKLDRRIDVGTPSPTSVVFCGDDFGTLFITTARHQLPEKDISDRAGALLSCRPGVKGYPPNQFKGQHV